MLRRFSDPAKIPISLTGGFGRQGWAKNPNETALLLTDLDPFKITPSQQACSIILCIIFLISILLNVISCHCLRRLANCRGLHIVKILVYITALDCINLLVELNHIFMNVTSGVPMFTVAAFLGRWSCQILAMVSTFLIHTGGLLITTLAFDSLIFLKHLKEHVARFRFEWAFNIFILIIATTATISCQFFWTFDIFHVDSRISPSEINIERGNFIEPSLYMCGFSASWGLSAAFTSYIWPALDHLLGDILPCLLPLAAGLAILVKRQNPVEIYRRGVNTESTQDLNQFMRILPILHLLNGLPLFPRMLFYTAKYYVFSG